MPTVGTHFAHWLTVLGVAFAPLTGAAQPPEVDTPKSRADFQKLVLERANPDSLATDHGGAWDNIYRYLVPARFLDRNLYEQALLQLAPTEGGGCEAAKQRQAALACEANAAADVGSSLTGFTESVLFRRDAVAFAESIAAADPGPLIDSLLRLAHDEWTHGLMTEVEVAVHRAAAIIAGRPESATHERRVRLAVLKARWRTRISTIARPLRPFRSGQRRTSKAPPVAVPLREAICPTS